MYYINENKDVLEKYKVNIKKTKLRQLIPLIIQNCGEIIIAREETSVLPLENELTIRNLEAKFLTKVEYVDGPSEEIYEVRYEKVIEPKVVSFLKKILDQEENSLYELIEYVSVKKTMPSKKKKVEEILKKEKKLIDQMLQNPSELDDNMAEMLNLYKELVAAKEYEALNEKKQPEEMYYAAIFSCFSFKLVERLDKQKMEETLQFYDGVGANKRILQIGKSKNE